MWANGERIILYSILYGLFFILWLPHDVENGLSASGRDENGQEGRNGVSRLEAWRDLPAFLKKEEAEYWSPGICVGATSVWKPLV